MKKFIIAVVSLIIAMFPMNAQYKQHGIIGFGLTKGFASFSNQDRGNIGLYSVIWRIESELYFDTGNYDDLEEDLGEHYTDYYKTYAGTSYTKRSATKYYTGGFGMKLGYMFTDYLSFGFAWEIAGGYTEIIHEHTHWSSIHENPK